MIQPAIFHHVTMMMPCITHARKSQAYGAVVLPRRQQEDGGRAGAVVLPRRQQNDGRRGEGGQEIMERIRKDSEK